MKRKKNRSARVLLGLISAFVLTSVEAAEPLWTITPAPGNNPTQSVPQHTDTTLSYIVQNQSQRFKQLQMQPIQGIVQTEPCMLAPIGQSGSSCTLELVINGSKLPSTGIHGGPVLCEAGIDNHPNPNQCYRASQANSLNINTFSSATATISISPTSLKLAQSSSGMIRVTNSSDSAVPATNVQANIPSGSSITMQNSTCGPSLAAGAACSIQFQSTQTLEGPTTITIAGNNTNTVALDVTVANLLQISITSPIQQNRIVTVSGITPLDLQVTNNAVVPVTNITVSDQSACPDLSVDASDCLNVPSNGNCLLHLSSNTPYAPCNISVSGTNTTSPEALIAFAYLGGLVFEENAGTGKVVIDVAQQFVRRWSNTFNNIPGAFSLNNGKKNTDAIVASPDCTAYLPNCAAQGCRDISADWSLPAINELHTIYTSLCSNQSSPCNFGDFPADFTFYWSSSQSLDNAEARAMTFFTGSRQNVIVKNDSLPVRCVRSFTP